MFRQHKQTNSNFEFSFDFHEATPIRTNRNSRLYIHRVYIGLIPSLAQWQRTGPGEVLTVLISRDLAPSATQTQALLVWDTLTCPRHDV